MKTLGIALHAALGLGGIALLALVGDLFDALAFAGLSLGLALLGALSEPRWLDLRWLGLHGAVAWSCLAACNHLEGYPDDEVWPYLQFIVLWSILTIVVLLLAMDRRGRWVWALTLATLLTPMVSVLATATRTAALAVLADTPSDLGLLWATRLDGEVAFAVLQHHGPPPGLRVCNAIPSTAPCPCDLEVGIYRWQQGRLVYDRSACPLGAPGGSMDAQQLRPQLAVTLVSWSLASTSED